MNKQKDNIINGNCWIAYFDVLGFKNKVVNFPIEFIRDKLNEALEHGRQFNAICRFKHFSDSFIFYTENDFSDSFLKIRDISMYFYSALFTEFKIPPFPIRGCLNVGQLYL